MFLEYLNKWIKENEQLLNKQQLIVEHIIDHGGKKTELGISNNITKNGGSFELLIDGTCDVMIIDYKTNGSLFFGTFYLKDTNELKNAIDTFILKMISR
jgi:aminopeptidase-like protein